MGVDNYPYIFKLKMNDLFHGLEFICSYMNEILILTKGDWIYHVQKLESMVNKLKEKDLNVIWHVLGLGKKFCNGPGTEFVCSLYHLFLIFATVKLIIYIYIYIISILS